MIIKLCGSILVILAAGGYGYLKSIELQHAYEQLLEVKRWMLLLRGEIRFAKSTLQDAFFHVGNRCEKPFSDFLIDVSKALEKREGRRFDEIWKEKIAPYEEQFSLRKKDFEKLYQFGGNLGFLDDEMQIRMIDLYIEELETEVKQVQPQLKEQKKLYRCLGIMCGVFTAVLLF